MTGMDIYLITRLDCVKEFAAIIATLAVIGSAILTALAIVSYCCEEDRHKVLKRCAIGFWVLTILFGTIYIAAPTTKEMAAIIVVPKIINNEQVQELPENIVELANDWIKTKSKELKTPN